MVDALIPAPSSQAVREAQLDLTAKQRLDARQQFEQGVRAFQLTPLIKSMPIGTLIQRLRYLDPKSPTDLETRLIAAFQGAFPELVPDFRSFQDKPAGCSCMGKIMATLNTQLDKSQLTLDQALGKRIFTLLAHVGIQLIGSMVGMSTVIDATPEAWTKYFTDMMKLKGHGSMETLRKQYTGVHVKDIEGGKKWLLLFY